MVRERLRVSGRTWWEHILSTGAELVTLFITGVLMVDFIIVAYSPDLYHYVEEIDQPILAIMCIYVLAGGAVWLAGWYLEKRTNATRGLNLDITGALLLATGWAGLLLGVTATGGGDWTARAIAMALSMVWGLRALAAQRIQSSAERIQKVINSTGYDLQGDSHGMDN